MKDQKIEIKKGITFHKIETNKFKTNLFAIFLTLPLTRETVTKNALLTAILRRGTVNFPTQELISKELEEMYGAEFNCGIEKTGDYHTIKFYLEAIEDQYLPQKEELTKQAIKLLLEIAFHPYTENNAFKEEYVAQEKENLKQIIEGKIDNKGSYALERCIEEMYKEKPYGLYKYGYMEDLENITAKDLYDYYVGILQTCKIDIFSSGESQGNIEEMITEDENIQTLQERNITLKAEEKNEIKQEPNVIKESMEVSQGKLVLGLDVDIEKDNLSYITMVYNTMLGVGANSKLFQNVREKASLAYTCSSNYIKRKQIILIRAGIEIQNYEKALEIIKEQLEEIKQGQFTQEDIQSAKNLIYATINNIEEEQDTEISYYFGQELAQNNVTVQEYKEKVEQVTREEIIEVANQIKINTIYFLKD